jgi:hypothetical protein
MSYRGEHETISVESSRAKMTHITRPYFFSGVLFAGGRSLLNTSRFFAMYDSQLGGTSSPVKIAVTGHSGTHAPQSMHSSGIMNAVARANTTAPGE